MTEPTVYTINISSGLIWTAFASYLLGCFCAPFLEAVARGIVNFFTQTKSANPPTPTAPNERGTRQ